MRAAGLEVTRVTGLDLRDPARVLARLEQARSRAAYAAPSQRGWTLTPPGWFRPRLSVDDRRALSW